jgi:hypothetical protein
MLVEHVLGVVEAANHDVNGLGGRHEVIHAYGFFGVWV